MNIIERNFFQERREELKIERFLQRLHQQPIMTKARRARFEAVEHEGNALGKGLGFEYYHCDPKSPSSAPAG